MSNLTPEQLERLETARIEVRRAIDRDTLILIHPFDLAKLLGNPTTCDACVINLDNRQYMFIDGFAYRCTADVKNKTRLDEMMA